ncbi:hypothetical protein TNCT_630531 [Trichonephila clavata]|uniref:Uncharacterized protein n=1 Tax=Trichonephila clavata TaxID=2740835 RepID=A0A8X6M2C9_TRICU|nr:hypothetical protein TNCT_630531 [Trichonephila clavata]
MSGRDHQGKGYDQRVVGGKLEYLTLSDSNLQSVDSEKFFDKWRIPIVLGFVFKNCSVNSLQTIEEDKLSLVKASP